MVLRSSAGEEVRPDSLEMLEKKEEKIVDSLRSNILTEISPLLFFL